MKIIFRKDYISLIPENDLDHFDLGRLSMKVEHKIVVSKFDFLVKEMQIPLQVMRSFQ